jgi:hypothetical protein
MMTVEVQLTRGMVALVDDADWPQVDAYKWHAVEARPGIFYAETRLRNARCPLRMHRFLLDAQTGQVIDHRNHNGLDNRRGNIRFCTITQNNQNQKLSRRNTTGYKGVSWHSQAQKYQVFISLDGRNRNLGLFSDVIEAAQAYDRAAQGLYGEFASLNFPGVEYGEVCEESRPPVMPAMPPADGRIQAIAANADDLGVYVLRYWGTDEPVTR